MAAWDAVIHRLSSECNCTSIRDRRVEAIRKPTSTGYDTGKVFIKARFAYVDAQIQ